MTNATIINLTRVFAVLAVVLTLAMLAHGIYGVITDKPLIRLPKRHTNSSTIAVPESLGSGSVTKDF